MSKIKKNNLLPPKVIIVKTKEDINNCLSSLIENKQIIINLSSCELLLKYRIVDFLSGYVYGINGIREKIEENIYSFRLF